MKSEPIPVSDNYQDYLLDYLQKNPHLAAAYLTATLEEENPEPELLLQALAQVCQALSVTDEQIFNSFLDLSEAKTIYKFVNLLDKMGFKISIDLVNCSKNIAPDRENFLEKSSLVLPPLKT